MGKIQLTIFWIGICLCFESAFTVPISNEITTEELRKIMTTIPESERKDFIRTYIDLGYKIEQLHNPIPSEEDGELAVQIFNYFIDNQDTIRARQEAMNAMHLKETVCYPDPIGCIDPDDPGIRP